MYQCPSDQIVPLQCYEMGHSITGKLYGGSYNSD